MCIIDQMLSAKLFDMGSHSKYSLFLIRSDLGFRNKKLRCSIIAYSDKNKNS